MEKMAKIFRFQFIDNDKLLRRGLLPVGVTVDMIDWAGRKLNVVDDATSAVVSCCALVDDAGPLGAGTTGDVVACDAARGGRKLNVVDGVTTKGSACTLVAARLLAAMDVVACDAARGGRKLNVVDVITEPASVWTFVEDARPLGAGVTGDVVACDAARGGRKLNEVDGATVGMLVPICMLLGDARLLPAMDVVACDAVIGRKLKGKARAVSVCGPVDAARLLAAKPDVVACADGTKLNGRAATAVEPICVGQ